MSDISLIYLGPYPKDDISGSFHYIGLKSQAHTYVHAKWLDCILRHFPRRGWEFSANSEILAVNRGRSAIIPSQGWQVYAHGAFLIVGRCAAWDPVDALPLPVIVPEGGQPAQAVVTEDDGQLDQPDLVHEGGQPAQTVVIQDGGQHEQPVIVPEGDQHEQPVIVHEGGKLKGNGRGLTRRDGRELDELFDNGVGRE